MRSNFEKVLDFHQKFGVPKRDIPEFPTVEELSARYRKIEEELDEFREEMAKVQFEGVPEDEEAKKQLLAFITGEAIDVIYTFYGLLALCGVNADSAFHAIHMANMTKTAKDGKIVKGPDFMPTNLKDVIFHKPMELHKSPWSSP